MLVITLGDDKIEHKMNRKSYQVKWRRFDLSTVPLLGLSDPLL